MMLFSLIISFLMAGAPSTVGGHALPSISAASFSVEDTSAKYSGTYNYTVVLNTTMGNIVIGLFDDMPITAGNFENLTQHGIYDDTVFHRVVHNFVIQGGDVSWKGIIVPTIPDELPNEHSNVRGSVAMAKTSLPNSATSQFYINLVDNTYLDSYYSVFGQVVQGMDVVDSIGSVQTDINDRPLQDVIILNAQLVARPRTWIVDDDGPADFSTIQEAINAAGDGDTVFVRNGTYYECVSVNKTLSVRGSGSESTIINGSQLDSVVEIGANNVDFGGFTVCGGGFGLKVYSNNNNIHDNDIVENGFIGIYLYLSSRNTFTSNNITTNYYGVSLVHSGGNSFKHNSISDNEWQELVIEGNTISNFVEDMDTSNRVDGKPIYYWVNQQDKIIPSDAGYVALVECRRILIQNLAFYRNGQGVLLAGTSDSTIENDTLSSEYHGIYMVDSDNVTIRNCTITNCNFAMEIWFSNGNKIIGNNMVSNAYGIELAWSDYNNVSRNTIEQTSEYNGWGVCLAVSAVGNRIYENDFINNSQGINIQLFYPGAGENKIYHNNFVKNAIQVCINESVINAWDDDYPSGGNYWSDYNGTDADQDGIGDTAYFIDANNTDRYPLMNVYWNLCDINHDLKIDMRDIDSAVGAFNTLVGDPLWNPHADITGPSWQPDGKVDMRDVGLIARHFGESYQYFL